MTTQIALISVEGVLANGLDLRSAPAQRWARPLYEAIHSQYRTVGLSGWNSTLTKSWLRKEALDGWSAVLGNDSILEFQAWKVAQLRDFLANAWEVAFLVDSDLYVCSAAQDMGVLTLRLGTPLNWPGWKAEDTGYRPWADLSDTVESSP